MRFLIAAPFLAFATAAYAVGPPVLRLHDDYTMFNGVKVEGMEAVLKQLDPAKEKNVSVEAHLCLDTKRLVAAMDQLKAKGYTNISLSAYGSATDADCR